MLAPSVVQIIDKYLRFLCKISLKPLCMCTDNSLQKLQIFIPKAVSCSDSFILSTSCNFILQPPIPVPRYEPVYSNVDSSLGMHEQSNVQSKLMTNHVSKRSTGLRELKGLFLWLNTGNAVSFPSTDFSIISWKATNRTLVHLPGCKLALLSSPTFVLGVKNATTIPKRIWMAQLIEDIRS